MNRVILIGNLTRDPESRTTSSGVAVTTFTIACNRRFTNQQGVREADFINIVTWRQQAELCARYLSKGRRVGIVGSLQTRSYDAQDGSTRYGTEVDPAVVELPSTRKDGASRSGFGQVPPPAEPPQANPAVGFAEVDDDELPF